MSASIAAEADTQCGSVSAGWNAPNGAAVFSHSPGIITGVISSLGEYRTHSMLSRGPGGWVSHATAGTPGTQDECSLPIDTTALTHPAPGLETVDQGAIYTFLYSGDSVTDHLAYQVPYAMDLTRIHDGDADLIGNDFTSTGQQRRSLSYHPMTAPDGSTVYGYDERSVAGRPQYHRTGQVFYGWNQYMNIGGTAGGAPPYYGDSGQGVQGFGVVCSTSLAMWQHDALYSTTSHYEGDMVPRTYPSTVVTQAANALWNSVHDLCMGQFTGFWGTISGFGNAIACSLTPGSICANAADEMTNCFAANDCRSDNFNEWNGIVTNNDAVSISPDQVGGWNFAAVGEINSAWDEDVEHIVQWNSGGSSYGCWEE
jgi:hypothetical protein